MNNIYFNMQSRLYSSFFHQKSQKNKKVKKKSLSTLTLCRHLPPPPKKKLKRKYTDLNPFYNSLLPHQNKELCPTLETLHPQFSYFDFPHRGQRNPSLLMFVLILDHFNTKFNCSHNKLLSVIFFIKFCITYSCITADQMPLKTYFLLVTSKRGKKIFPPGSFTGIGSGFGFVVSHTVIFKGKRVQQLPYKTAWEDTVIVINRFH